MAAKMVKFNRSDWSGTEAEAELLEGGQFRLMGYTFRLERQPAEEDDYFHYVAHIRGEGWQDRLGTVIRSGRDRCYMAMGMGIDRESEDPIVAACQLLCNTI